jgi:phosphoglycerol transferase MdoB-like AlkP superfamily enzyme
MKTIIAVTLFFCVLVKTTYFFLSDYWLEITFKAVYLSLAGFVLEVTVVVFIFLLIYSLTKRKFTSLSITGSLYLIFICSQVLKINLLGTPIFPADLMLVGDLLRTKEVYVIFLPVLFTFLIVSGLVLYFGYKKEKPKSIIIAPILTTVICCFFAVALYYHEESRVLLREHGVFYKKNANLTRRALKNGLLAGFVQVTFFTAEKEPPKNYTKESIERIIKKYNLNQSTTDNLKFDNVIVMLVESFTDPEEFGWRFSEPILPNFKNISKTQISGTVMSPVYGGKSINAEFELMTGMSNRFTPIETTPYQEFIDRNIPSLARTFKQNGYTTNAIQMVPFKGFGFEKIYDYLGVENQISLYPVNTEIISDPSGRSVSSEVIAEEVISVLKSQEKSFIFVFPNSSHAPWKLSHYPDSTLRLLNENVNQNNAETILAYTEALNHIDKMFGTVMNHIKATGEKTLIVIAGDHLPGFSSYLSNVEHPQKNKNQINLILNKYRTSIGVWASDESIPNKRIDISLNLIPSLIFNYTGMKTDGFMKFNSVLYNSFDVISHVFKEKVKDYSQKLENNQELIHDYSTLQYDLLFGSQYILTGNPPEK